MNRFKHLKQFFKNTSGNIATTMAILAIPLFAAAGVAADYSRLSNARSSAQNAVDSALISVASTEGLSEAEIERTTRDFLVTNYIDIGKLKSFDVDVQNNNDGRISVEFTGTLDTSLLSVAGIKTMDFTINAEAMSAHGYLDVYIMLDRSPSTLIADTPQDMRRLRELTKPMIEAAGGYIATAEPEGCAFACHRIPDAVDAHAWAPDDVSLVDFARNENIGLRINRIVDAAERMSLSILNESRGKTRVSMMNFGYDAQVVLDLTADTSTARQRISEDVGTLNISETNYQKAFDKIEATIGQQGTGNTRQSPRKMLALITDGYYTHFPNSVQNYHPFDAAFCDEVKNRNIEVAVVNTIYDEIPNSELYDNLARDNKDAATQALKDCASPDLYFEANSPGEINDSFEALAAKIASSTPRLTN